MGAIPSEAKNPECDSSVDEADVLWILRFAQNDQLSFNYGTCKSGLVLGTQDTLWAGESAHEQHT